MDEDRTLPVSSLFSLSIRVEKGHVVKQPSNYPSRFVVGRSDGSDLQFSDPFVGRSHAEVWFERGQWWVKDLGSVNKTYLNGELVEEASPLPPSGTIELGKEGVIFSVSIRAFSEHSSLTPFSQGFLDEMSNSIVDHSIPSSDLEQTPVGVPTDKDVDLSPSSPFDLIPPETVHPNTRPDGSASSRESALSSFPSDEYRVLHQNPLNPPTGDTDDHFQCEPRRVGATSSDDPSSLTGYIYDLVRDERLSLDEKGQKIRDAFRLKLQNSARLYYCIIGGISCVAVGIGLWAISNHLMIKEIREEATRIFTSIKTQQMEVLRIETYLSTVASPKVLQDVIARREAIQLMYKDYDAYLEKIGIYQRDLSEGDQIILRMARLFGECELNMPPDFLNKVKIYIRNWQSTPRLRQAIQRALSHGYPQKIENIMLQHGLPPQFFYLALQESDFDVRKIGPSRPPYGIAKGPWQFMPATAMDYKLRLGPLVNHPNYDPQDERHDFQKSTIAAAQHLRHLYTTEAQASSLLVLASYNWGQGNMRKIITQMPENPRERNFWKLLKNFVVPEETFDYVMYIFSAAVIGENPRLWGFELDNPLTKSS